MKFTGFISSFSFLLIIWILFPISTIISQNYTEPIGAKSLLDSTKKIYGSSELLVNGPLYYQYHRMANGTPYLHDQEFVEGEVFIAGKQFSDQQLNYDISRQMIVLFVSTQESKLIVSLSDKLVDSLYISNELFVNSRFVDESSFPYLQLIEDGIYQMYIGYEKQFINRYNDDDPHGRYSSSQRTIFIKKDGDLISLKSNSSFLSQFPIHRNEIKSYLKSNKLRFLKASPTELSELMKFCNKLVN